MTHAEIQDRTKAYIRENFLYTRPDHPLAEDDRLLELGIIDSMGVMELIDFIQDTFGVEVQDDEITEDNLGTLRAITDYVAAKKGVAGAVAADATA